MKQLFSILFLCALTTTMVTHTMNKSNGKKETYYEILGISDNATASEIIKAYRKLAIQYHPDKNPGDKQAEERCKEISTAYDILKDADIKKAYDKWLKSPNPDNQPFKPNYSSVTEGITCYSCDKPVDDPSKVVGKSIVVASPCCSAQFMMCANCLTDIVLRGKGLKCPQCPEIMTIKVDKGQFVVNKTSKCLGANCTKITDKIYDNPCCPSHKIPFCGHCSASFSKWNLSCPGCKKNINAISNFFGGVSFTQSNCSGCTTQMPNNADYTICPHAGCSNLIYLCNACVTRLQVTCIGCAKNIVIKNNYGNIRLEAFTIKKCSGCTTQISNDTLSHNCPHSFCSHSISLCDTCSFNSQVSCPGCRKNITIKNNLGRVNLEIPAKMKKCSGCTAQIPENTDYNVCPHSGCYARISVCNTCSFNSQVSCPGCRKNITIKNNLGRVNLEIPAKMKKCSGCTAQIPENTYYNACPHPVCINKISICDTCIRKSQIQCSGCANTIVIKNNYTGTVRLETPTNIKHPKTKQCSGCTNQIPNNISSYFCPHSSCYNRMSLCDTCINKSQIACSGCFKTISIKKNRWGDLEYSIPEEPSISDIKKNIFLVGSVASALWCFKSAWMQYALCNELDAILQHAKKLMEERLEYQFNEYDLSLSLSEQFDIYSLAHKITQFVPNTDAFTQAITDFDIAIKSKQSKPELIVELFEAVDDIINQYKNTIGSPVKNIFCASVASSIGLLLWRKSSGNE
jgi:hypothetical protein